MSKDVVNQTDCCSKQKLPNEKQQQGNLSYFFA